MTTAAARAAVALRSIARRCAGLGARPAGWAPTGWTVLAVIAVGWAAAAPAAELLPDPTPAELRRILSHGPWPPPVALDAGNRHAANAAAIALGERLFFDARLSPDGQLSCASCHPPALAFADAQARSIGRQRLDRNAPSLWNAGLARWQGWDGAADSLWSQAIRPLLDAREMGSSAGHVTRVIAADARLACGYRRAFGRAAGGPGRDTGSSTNGSADEGTGDRDDEATLVDAAKAIGAFVGTLVSGRTAFDRYRDALARGDRTEAARYPPDAQRGLRLFIGRGQCSTCHVGALFSHGEFADIGLPFFVRPGVVDPGRHAGITALRASPYNLLSGWRDGPGDRAVLKTRHVEPQHRNFGEFKVPGLRNVALTAPYMHDGQLATLDDVLRHYATLDLDRLHADGERILQPLHLSDAEHADLRAFLETLTDPQARAWRPTPAAPCEANAP